MILHPETQEHGGLCTGPDCVRCRKAAMDPRYRRLWGVSDAEAAAWLAERGGRPRRRSVSGGQQQREGVELVPCPSCKGNVRIKVPQGGGSPVIEELPQSLKGRDHLASIAQARPSGVAPLTWAVGVTTVPERRSNGLLLLTLASLRAAGFGSDDRCSLRLFADGLASQDAGEWEASLGLSVTARWPVVRTVGNWFLAALELLARNPTAERFAVFQDDVLAVRNLRSYLEAAPLPERGYGNLFASRLNEDLIVGRRGWVEACRLNSQAYPEDWQKGLGALGLVFTRGGLTTLLASPHVSRKLTDVSLDFQGQLAGAGPNLWADGTPKRNGQMKVDGTIVTAMNLAGWHEFVHAPSLVQHAGGLESSMRNRPQRSAMSFPGEQFDALDLLK